MRRPNQEIDSGAAGSGVNTQHRDPRICTDPKIFCMDVKSVKALIMRRKTIRSNINNE